MARLLVTGGAGFIGTNFVQYWLQKHPDDRVVVLDALTYAGNRANLSSADSRSEFRFVHGDIRDTTLVETLLRAERLDTIVHFAAESHVDRSIEGPDIFVQANVIGTHSMLKAARRVWLDEKTVPSHRFHHVSTDEVYGSLGDDDPPFTEESPYAPNSPYSASKAASDHLVRAYHRTYGLKTTISNCSNNYGPYQFPEKLIPLIIANILQGKPLPVYGNGSNVRDWLYVEDHCRGIELILDQGVVGEVYNIGGGTECRNVELVRSLCQLADQLLPATPAIRDAFPNSPVFRGLRNESLLTFVTDRPGHDHRYAIDCSKARERLGYEPAEDLRAGLHQTFAWYLRNTDWWRLDSNSGPLESPPVDRGTVPAAGHDLSAHAQSRR